jgi:hypothetical protein
MQALSQFMFAGVHGLPTSASTRTVILPPGVGLAVEAGAELPPVDALPPVEALPPVVVLDEELLLSLPQAAASSPSETTLVASSQAGRFSRRELGTLGLPPVR